MDHHISPITVIDGLILLGFNCFGWLAAIFTWANISVIASVIAALAASSVSIASLLWIRKQSRAFDVEQEARRQNRLRDEAEAFRRSISK